MAIDNVGNIIGHLRTQFERAHPVLFTGAGFSADAKSISREPIPLVSELRKKLWTISFPGDPFEESSSLADLYQTARTRHPRQLTEMMTKNFTVEPQSLPDWYGVVLSLPWRRIYTLNVDDLARAANRRFNLPRELVPISAVRVAPNQRELKEPSRALEVIHLNGTLEDVPERVTFSTAQYAERLVRDEPWYIHLIQDLIGRPVVFIGTSVEEPPLWQYIEKRKSRGGKAEQELRPKSYLVTRSLPKAKQAFLSEHHIVWVQASGAEFCSEVLVPVSAEAAHGFDYLRAEVADRKDEGIVHDVSELATGVDTLSQFLTGAEPTWADIQFKRSIDRDSDAQLVKHAESVLANKDQPRGLLLITGTAGNGKSTALKRLALALSSGGHRVAWVDSNSNVSPKQIRDVMFALKAPTVLAIDDADQYGSELSSLIREIALTGSRPLVVAAVRSVRVDRVINAATLEKVPQKEVSVPGLTDKDIDALLDLLDKQNLLGVLAGKDRQTQRTVLRDKCGRQLLVAMIEATSGEPFEKKIVDELAQLEGEAHKLYAFVATASALRFGLTKDDLFSAIGEVTNQALNALQRLVSRHLVTFSKPNYNARHRVVAEVVFQRLSKDGQLAEILSGLAFSAAMHVSPETPFSAPPRRLLQRILNHDFLLTNIGEDEARNLYGELEDLLRRDFNYWLHRGSLELELGKLEMAERYLNNARGYNPYDLNTQTEYAYLLLRKALADPRAGSAQAMVDEADGLLTSNIAARGDKDPHSYHVLGANMLQWIRTGVLPADQQKNQLERMIRLISEGRKKHPKNDHLATLARDLEAERSGFSMRKIGR